MSSGKVKLTSVPLDCSMLVSVLLVTKFLPLISAVARTSAAELPVKSFCIFAVAAFLYARSTAADGSFALISF